MCTALEMQLKAHYFGRTLDWMFSYGEKVIITPRKYVFEFQHLHLPALKEHYAMIGMAAEQNNYPFILTR